MADIYIEHQQLKIKQQESIKNEQSIYTITRI